MAGAIGLVDGEPFLVASSCVSVRLQFQPGLAAVCGAVDVIAKCLQQAEVEKGPGLIRVQHWVAAEHARLQDTRKGPRDAAISGVSPAALPEVGRVGVKLSPAYGHSAGVGWIHCDRGFVSGVPDDVLVVRINVHLIADEAAIRGDHSRRSIQPVNIARWVIVFL